jgi:hypothetical protein
MKHLVVTVALLALAAAPAVPRLRAEIAKRSDKPVRIVVNSASVTR